MIIYRKFFYEVPLSSLVERQVRGLGTTSSHEPEPHFTPIYKIEKECGNRGIKFLDLQILGLY